MDKINTTVSPTLMLYTLFGSSQHLCWAMNTSILVFFDCFELGQKRNKSRTGTSFYNKFNLCLVRGIHIKLFTTCGSDIEQFSNAIPLPFYLLEY